MQGEMTQGKVSLGKVSQKEVRRLSGFFIE